VKREASPYDARVPTTTDLILSSLNAEQRKAVEHTEGPTFILAGAGSGKTRALTHRIAYLIHKGVPPWQILAVTFTNKAAKEMKERIQNLLHITEESSVTLRGQMVALRDDSSLRSESLSVTHRAVTKGDTTTFSPRLPATGTFHSICVRILRRDIEHLGRERTFVIYDTDDQEKLMKEVFKELKIDESDCKVRPALGYIGRFKAEALGPKEVAEQATNRRSELIASAYERYQKKLRTCNALDFDDLILEVIRLFHECPAVLERYQRTWRYLHIDEYQDTNHAQYLFATLLAKTHRNLCVIGDPDQSIYGFRGADIRNILEFRKEYPDAFSVTLEQNYRSIQPILTAADTVIAANPHRPEKRMWTDQKEGPKVILQEVDSERAEAEEAIRTVEEQRKNGLALAEQVILYRTNAQSRLFEEACMRRGLPYRIVGGFKFYARGEVKDVLAYLHVLQNPEDTVALLRILNVPSRKIGAITLGRIQSHASAHSLTLWETLRSVNNIEDIEEGPQKRIGDFVDCLQHFQKRAAEIPVRHLTQELLETIGMEKWIRDQTEEGEERWRNIQELLTVMQKYDALEPQISLVSFLEEVALISEVDKMNDMQDDALTIMTLHLCKGLEFEHAIIAGCEEGLLPHSSSLFDKEQLEEERRLLYVGMTRAKTHLRLLCARGRFLWGQTQTNAPSRFLDDLPEEVIERRSDDVLSAFAWAVTRGERLAKKSPMEHLVSSRADSRDELHSVEPYRQVEPASDFNQETVIHDDIQEGTRVHHPTHGHGTVTARRGDVVEIAFDSGKKKKFATSIAPLRIL